MHMILHRVNKLILKKTKTVLQFIKASQRVTNSQSFHKRISTHLLTVLAISAILQLEQRKGIKRERKIKVL